MLSISNEEVVIVVTRFGSQIVITLIKTTNSALDLWCQSCTFYNLLAQNAHFNGFGCRLFLSFKWCF